MLFIYHSKKSYHILNTCPYLTSYPRHAYSLVFLTSENMWNYMRLHSGCNFTKFVLDVIFHVLFKLKQTISLSL